MCSVDERLGLEKGGVLLALLVEDFGVLRTRTIFFMLDLRGGGVPAIFVDKLVPNFRLEDLGG